jgi:hypothetical protein
MWTRSGHKRAKTDLGKERTRPECVRCFPCSGVTSRHQATIPATPLYKSGGLEVPSSNLGAPISENPRKHGGFHVRVLFMPIRLQGSKASAKAAHSGPAGYEPVGRGGLPPQTLSPSVAPVLQKPGADADGFNGSPQDEAEARSER